jgi:hypothetical protein
MVFHPRVGLFAGRAGQPPEAVGVLTSPRRSVRLAVTRGALPPRAHSTEGKTPAGRSGNLAAYRFAAEPLSLRLNSRGHCVAGTSCVPSRWVAPGCRQRQAPCHGAGGTPWPPHRSHMRLRRQAGSGADGRASAPASRSAMRASPGDPPARLPRVDPLCALHRGLPRGVFPGRRLAAAVAGNVAGVPPSLTAARGSGEGGVSRSLPQGRAGATGGPTIVC